jgi:chromatin remodeling complex protein RSC6
MTEKQEEIEEILEEKPEIKLNKKERLIENTLNDYNEILSGMEETLQSFKNNIKIMKKFNNKLQKNLKNISIERNKRDQKNNPSGFNKPLTISKELCVFFDIPEESKLARTTVTKKIHDYIKVNELKDEEDGRIIKLNSELQSLFDIEEETINFFELQKYLNKHFEK